MTKQELLNLAADYRRLSLWLFRNQSRATSTIAKLEKNLPTIVGALDEKIREIVLSPLQEKAITKSAEMDRKVKSEAFLTASLRLLHHLGR